MIVSTDAGLLYSLQIGFESDAEAVLTESLVELRDPGDCNQASTIKLKYQIMLTDTVWYVILWYDWIFLVQEAGVMA